MSWIRFKLGADFTYTKRALSQGGFLMSTTIDRIWPAGNDGWLNRALIWFVVAGLAATQLGWPAGLLAGVVGMLDVARVWRHEKRIADMPLPPLKTPEQLDDEISAWRQSRGTSQTDDRSKL